MLFDEASQLLHPPFVFIAGEQADILLTGNSRRQPQYQCDIRGEKLAAAATVAPIFIAETPQALHEIGGVGILRIEYGEMRGCKPLAEPAAVAGKVAKIGAQHGDDEAVYIPRKTEAVVEPGRNRDDRRRLDGVAPLAENGIACAGLDV